MKRLKGFGQESFSMSTVQGLSGDLLFTTAIITASQSACNAASTDMVALCV